MGRLELAVVLSPLRYTALLCTVISAIISEICRRTPEVTADNRETVWLEQKLGFALQRGNMLIILTAVCEKYDIELRTLTAYVVSTYFQNTAIIYVIFYIEYESIFLDKLPFAGLSGVVTIGRLIYAIAMNSFLSIVSIIIRNAIISDGLFYSP